MKTWKKILVMSFFLLQFGAVYGATENKVDINFNSQNYSVKTITVDGISVNYRAFEKIIYVGNPVDTEYQIMNFFVPEEYYQGKSINGYNISNAPIFLPNKVGGYMPAKPGSPGTGMGGKGASAEFFALSKGYIVASPGARGRSLQNTTGEYTGKAPAGIVDLKAAVRYLKYNDKIMPGDAEKIISNGTSAGGGLSALLGATGNNKDYEPYLEEIGAAKAKDDIFAVSAYCPITNLDNADMAYEWQFNGINEYKSLKITRDTDYQIQRTFVTGTMTEKQIALSQELKKLFPNYLNSLKLKDDKGNTLTLDQNGKGTFYSYIKNLIISSAQKALDEGKDLSSHSFLSIKDKKVIDIDFESYLKYMGRLKTTAAFDSDTLSTGENDLFGTKVLAAQHFTEFGKNSSTVNGTMANKNIVKIMNPMNYLDSKDSTISKYWRIRHGAKDSDTSLAISGILSAKLNNAGYSVDYFLPWDVPHSGDYDLEELFAWADKIVKNSK